MRFTTIAALLGVGRRARNLVHANWFFLLTLTVTLLVFNLLCVPEHTRDLPSVCRDIQAQEFAAKARNGLSALLSVLAGFCVSLAAVFAKVAYRAAAHVTSERNSR